MTAGTLTRADIAARINQQVGLSRNESATIVESILAHMSDALAAGQNVKISGFGTFVLRDKAERVGRLVAFPSATASLGGIERGEQRATDVGRTQLTIRPAVHVFHAKNLRPASFSSTATSNSQAAPAGRA